MGRPFGYTFEAKMHQVGSQWLDQDATLAAGEIFAAPAPTGKGDHTPDRMNL